MYSRFTVAFVILLLSSLSAEAQSSRKCTPLTFDTNGNATVHEHIPDFLPLCYSFVAKDGQHAKISITKDYEMGFDLSYVQPDGSSFPIPTFHHAYDFTTETKTYRILAASDAPHGNTSEYFILMVSVSTSANAGSPPLNRSDAGLPRDDRRGEPRLPTHG